MCVTVPPVRVAVLAHLIGVLLVDKLSDHDDALLLEALAHRHPRRRCRSVARVRDLGRGGGGGGSRGRDGAMGRGTWRLSGALKSVFRMLPVTLPGWHILFIQPGLL